MISRHYTLSLLVVFPLLLATSSRGRERRFIRALSVPTGTIVIDGRLDEPHWSRADGADDFILLEPTPGELASQQTVARVLYDPEIIYFGFHCAEDRLDKIQASATRHDSEVWLDDAVEVFLDTYWDRRSCYYFMANTIGTRLDGRVNDEGRVIDQNWDAEWQVATSMVDGGWQMEMAIPLQELSFHSAEVQIWGINFWRTERPHWENSYWAETGENIFKVSNFGDLVGLTDLRRRRQLKAIPSVVGKLERLRGRRDLDKGGDLGLDLQYAVTSNLIANVTINPDFAQIEADQDRFNLSYQEGEEIFFPEKRPFFLEGIEILQTPLNLLYTRRMVDIVYGAKVTGKAGRFNLAALNVGTTESDNQRNNYSAVRFQGDIFSSATVGMLLTDKEEKGGGFSRAAGVDLHLPVYDPLDLNLQVARCHNPGVTDGEWAATANFGGESEIYQLDVTLQSIGEHFAVHQGYIPFYSVGRREGSLYLGRRFLRDRRGLRWLRIAGFVSQQEDTDGRLTRRAGELFCEVVTAGKLRPFVCVERSFQRYDDDEFDDLTGYVGIETNVGGWSGTLAKYEWGELFGKRWQNYLQALCLNFFGRTSLFIQNQFNRWGEAPWDWIGWARINVQLRPDTFWRSFVQRNSDEHTFLINTLIGHEFSPGTILYVGYNQTRKTSGEDQVDHLALAKLTYLLKI